MRPSPATSERAHADGARGDLYATDFYAWTQSQAALLRQGRLGDVDAGNLLEEIETLGRKEVAELRSRLRILSAHLLKAMFQPERASKSWATTILNQRIAIADHIDDNPSLTAKLDEAFTKAYPDARELAASETELPLETFPVEPPFRIADALSRTWMPAAGRSNRGSQAR